MRRSYSERLLARRKAFRFLRLAVLAFCAIGTMRACILQSWKVSSTSMQPGLQPGDRLMVSPLPFGAETVFGKLPALVAPSRGQIVLTHPSSVAQAPFLARLGDSLARFFTLQIVSPMAAPGSGIPSTRSIKRVVGLPGDTVRMEDWVLYVKPAGSDSFLPEFQAAGMRYAIQPGYAPPGWDRDLPGSGHLADRRLAEGEFFLAGDARGSTSDSLLRGPYSREELSGAVLFRFWPPGRMGLP